MPDNKQNKYRLTHSVWELTLACNMQCLHCGSYAGKPRKDEIPLERALKLADELADLGLQRITLSGGEPMLREGWEQIAQRLVSRGVQVGIISNGWYMEENVDKIAALPRFDVAAMSLDGLRRTHDSFRRTPGSFDRILSAFLALKKKKIRSACITCVSKYNLHELDTIHDVLVSHGVYAWQIQPLFTGGRTREYDDMMISVKELYDVAKFIARKKKVSPLNIFPADGVGYYSPYEPVIRPGGWCGCQAGLRVVGIEANGNIKGCLSLLPEARENNPFVEGNIMERSLKDIWEDPDKFAFNRKFDCSKAEGACKGCKHLKDCKCGCSAEAFFSTGSIYNNPYCIHKEIQENGKPEYQTTVPVTEEFVKKLNEYYEKNDKKRQKPTLKVGNRSCTTS